MSALAKSPLPSSTGLLAIMAKDTKAKKAALKQNAPVKTQSAPKPSKKPVATPEPSQELDGVDEEDAESEEEEEESDLEGEDVNEEGMARLMAALGDDGLDDFAQAELQALAGEDEDEDDESGEDDDEGEESEEEVDAEDAKVDEDNEDEDDKDQAEEGSNDEDDDDQEEEEEDEDVALDEVESVEADVVPRQKLEIDNKVCSPSSRPKHLLDYPR